MIQARAWPVRAMYILFAAALAISLIITAAPAHRVDAATDEVDAEWDRVDTPTTEDFVLTPNSYIIDYAVGDDGEVAYAIVYDGDPSTSTGCLLKSEDHAATWDDDIFDELLDELDDDKYTLDILLRVACDPEDSDFVAVALCTNEISDTCVHVYISTDGGDSFEDGDTGEVEDDGAYFNNGWDVTDLAISPADEGEREIAIVGTDDDDDAVIFRCQVDGDHPGKWRDARYDGWDDDADFEDTPNPRSMVVTDVKFAPSWKTDQTILITTVEDTDGYPPDADDYYNVHLQTGTWGTTEGWNEQSLASIPAVLINSDSVHIPLCLAMVSGYGMQDFRGIAGLTLPSDYSGRDAGERYVWVWMNYYEVGTNTPTGTIFKVKDDDAGTLIGGKNAQVDDGEVWLTNVDYLGTIAEGKAIAGVMGTGKYGYAASCPGNYSDLFTECCEGVQVYRNEGIRNMDICCESWEDSCKPPTGTKAMAAFYASDDKAYAVALWAYDPWYNAEGAWSVSFDDGYTWNQLSLIDTDIDYLSDVAVSPDCNKIMLVSVNDCTEESYRCCCDSVWLHAEDLPEAEEYSGKWLRTWCGKLTDTGEHEFGDEWGFLRLSPEETDGMTVYLVDYYTDIVYWNELETLACWEDGTATVEHIVDLAVKDNETIYALDADGDVAMSDDYALGWYETVETELEEGFTIAVWGDHIIVGGCDGDVSYSADFDPEDEDTFTELEDVADDGCVTVAFDSYFDTNNTVYAAIADGDDDNGVYSFVIDESEEWKDLHAEPTAEDGLCCGDDNESIEVDFTGLVVDTAEGNPMTSAETGGVLYASFYYDADGVYNGDLTGVARRLNPAEETVCPTCVEWDYLIEGLPNHSDECYDIGPDFAAYPDALKICGCLTPDSNSKLFAIDYDDWGYDMYHPLEEGDNFDGGLWMFEDCYAKKAPDLIYPGEGDTLPSDPCDCIPLPFTMRWDRLCDACSYDVQIALDEDFNEVILDTRYRCYTGDGTPTLDRCCTYSPPEGETPSAYFLDIWGEYRVLICEFTYYWRVRAADAATDQIIHSWWSEPFSFTVAPGPGTGVELIAPENGATSVAVNDIPFSWTEVASATEYDWMLSANADMSSPIATAEALPTPSGKYSGTALDYETAYFWQVTALKDGSPISTSEIGTFTTAAAAQFCCPQCGLCFDTQAELQEHIEEMHGPITPVWVWVVIAIGAVLVIVVIVLIFRTRRV